MAKSLVRVAVLWHAFTSLSVGQCWANRAVIVNVGWCQSLGSMDFNEKKIAPTITTYNNNNNNRLGFR